MTTQNKNSKRGGVVLERLVSHNPVHDRAIEYIKNAGGKPTIKHFDEDHEPVGPRLREELKAAWRVYEYEGRIMLDPEYGEGTRGEVSNG